MSKNLIYLIENKKCNYRRKYVKHHKKIRNILKQRKNDNVKKIRDILNAAKERCTNDASDILESVKISL